MSTNSHYSYYHQILYENTCWQERKLPNDIFNLIIIYISKGICGYCKSYMDFGQEICIPCLSKQEQQLTEERSSLEQKISSFEEEIRFLSQFCGDLCKQNMESYDYPIQNQINEIEKKEKYYEDKLQKTKEALEFLKKNYQLTADLKGMDVQELLLRIHPEKITYYDHKIHSLETKIQLSKTKIAELKPKLIGPFEPAKCNEHYSKFGCNTYCNRWCTFTGGSKEKFIIKREEIIRNKQKLLDQFNKNKQFLELVAKYKRQNEKFIKYYLSAQKHHITWDENSLAQEDLFFKMGKKKELRRNKHSKKHK